MSLWKRFRRRDEEIDEEIRAHLRMAIEERIARGEAPEDAAKNARREFGNELMVKEVTREMWGWNLLERFAQDLKYIFRQMRRSPGFTAIAVLTLALGLGATTAMFSIVNGVLLEPMKYRDPGRLYLAQTVMPASAKVAGNWPVNGRHFQEWRANCRSCEDVSLAEGSGFTLTGMGQPERLPGLRISYNFFRTLGVRPSLGRDFLPEEELPGRFHEVILANSLWRSRFLSDPGIVGRAIEIDGEAHTVIGVMPPDLQLPVGGQWGVVFTQPLPPVIFRPLGIDVSRESPGEKFNYVSVLRLKPGVQPQQAIAEMNALLAEFAREFKLESKTTLVPLQDQVTAGARSGLWLLLGTVGAVLLIVCVNIGNLMLVRTTGRYREAGIRIALGARSSHLFGLALREALVLVVIGGALGLVFSYAGLKLFAATAPIGLPRIDEVRMDWRVLAFAAFTAVFSTALCGLLPAWRLAKTEPQESLKSGSSNASESGRKVRLREMLVSVEVALSTVLLIAGGLLILSFFRVMRADKGFEVAHIVTQDISLIGPKYTDPARSRFVSEALRKLANIPGASSVGVTNQLPLRGETWLCELLDTDRPGPPEEESALANFRFVSPGYWKTMGIPLNRGRFFEESDRNRLVAVISEQAAKLLWPGRNPIGRRVRACGTAIQENAEVIGIVGDVRAGIEQGAPPTVYLPYNGITMGRASFVLRTQADPAAVIGAMRAVLRSMDPDLPLSQTQTMEQILDESVAVRRFQMYLAAAFAMAALVLASLGIYGVVSFSVARRTPEMGIRIALGARGMQLMAMVIKQGMIPVLLGLGAGLACALSLGRFLASQLYGISPDDPMTISAVAALLLVVALCACWIPARRATRIDPMRALRSE